MRALVAVVERRRKRAAPLLAELGALERAAEVAERAKMVRVTRALEARAGMVLRQS